MRIFIERIKTISFCRLDRQTDGRTDKKAVHCIIRRRTVKRLLKPLIDT